MFNCSFNPEVLVFTKLTGKCWVIPFIHHIVAYKLLLFPIYFGRIFFRSFSYANILYLINEKNNFISLYDTMMNNWY